MDYENTYKKAVIKTFDFLINKYNYKLYQKNTYKIIFGSRDCRIHFKVDKSQLFIDFEPIGVLKKHCRGDGKYDMLTIINSLNSGAHLGYGLEIYSETDCLNEVNRLSQIMEKHCIEIITGDIAMWKNLVDKYRGTYAF